MSEEVFNAGNADMENIKTTVMGDNEEAAVKEEKPAAEEKPGKPSLESLNVDEDGITEYVTPDMLIGDIITWYPDASLVLMKCGMHCISCGVSQFETLDQACAVHGLYTDDVAKVVNDYLTMTLGGKAQRLAEEAEGKQ
jgi:hybrid cluster-associated redox disulfide protein